MIAHEETISSAGASVSQVITGNIGSDADQLYIVSIAVRSNIAVSSVSGGGLIWMLRKTQCSGRSQQGINIFTAYGSPGSAFAVTVNLTNSASAVAVSVSRYSGADSMVVIEDAVGENSNGENGACSSGSDGNTARLTTGSSNVNSVHFVAVNSRNRNVSVNDAFYTERANSSAGSGGNATRLSVHDHLKILAGDDVYSATLSGSTDWATAGLVIIPVSAGQTFNESLAFIQSIVPAANDLQFYLDTLSLSNIGQVNGSDIQKYLDVLNFSQSGAANLADLKIHLENLSIISSQLSVASDIQHYLERLPFSGQQSFSEADLQNYRDNLNFSQAQVTNAADLQKYFEGLALNIISVVSATDNLIQGLVENLTFIQSGSIAGTDRQHYLETLQFSALTAATALDAITRVENLGFSQGSTISATDRQRYVEALLYAASQLEEIQDTLIPAGPVAEQLTIIASTLVELLDKQIYKEPLSILMNQVVLLSEGLRAVAPANVKANFLKWLRRGFEKYMVRHFARDVARNFIHCGC